MVIIHGILVISSRTHYTLGVAVAFYTVPLVWITYSKHVPDKYPADLMMDSGIIGLEMFPSRRDRARSSSIGDNQDDSNLSTVITR